MIPALFPTVGSASSTDPLFASVVMLNHCNVGGGGFVSTSTVGTSWTGSGLAALSSTQAKFGGVSLACLTTGFATGGSYGPGAGSFAMEGWFYLTALPTSYSALFAIGANGNGSVRQNLYLASDGSIGFVYNAGFVIQTAASYITTSAWHFYQLLKDATAHTTVLAIDGVQAGSTYTDNNTYPTALSWFGQDNNLTSPITGYIDEYRWTFGATRSISLPTSPFPNS